MALNKKKGNMYGFVTHTWNTIKGKCPHECDYCYMKKWGNQKPMRFDEKELNTDLGNDNFIFVGSSCDMFAKNINQEWVEKTLYHCQQYKNKYLFQTKNPKALRFNDLPKNSTICTTIESDIDYDNYKGPSVEDRVKWFSTDSFEKMLTIEPIMEFNYLKMIDIVKKIMPFQVNIGANTNYSIKLKEPSSVKIKNLISEISSLGIVVFEKDNLKRLFK